MLGKILRYSIMLGVPLVLLAIFVISPMMKNNGSSSLVEGEGLVIVEDNGILITMDEAQKMLNYVAADHRAYLLENPENLKEFLLAKMSQKLLATEALAQGLDKKGDAEWNLEENKRTILTTALIEERRENTVIPGDIEQIALEYYLSNEEQFIAEESVDVAHILIRSGEEDDAEKKALAERVLQEINAGLSFEEAAQQYSDEVATADSGGVLGRYGRGQFVPPFEAAAFALENQDDLSEVTKTQYGYHIIKLLADNNPSSLIPFEDVKETIVLAETNKYLKLVLTEYAETFQRNDTKTVYVPAMEQLLESMQTDIELSETAD